MNFHLAAGRGEFLFNPIPVFQHVYQIQYGADMLPPRITMVDFYDFSAFVCSLSLSAKGPKTHHER
jgi:hypothetical protein